MAHKSSSQSRKYTAEGVEEKNGEREDEYSEKLAECQRYASEQSTSKIDDKELNDNYRWHYKQEQAVFTYTEEQ